MNLPVRLLGTALWTRLLESTAFELPQKDAFVARLHSLDALREHADYNTGSITTVSAWSLYAAVRAFVPQLIIEVGTFIGKSTIAMGLAADQNKLPATIHTCDLSNNISLPALCQTSIVQYPRKSSNDMFVAMLSDNMAGAIDFVHLDGRLSDQDLQPMRTLCKPETVFAFDDFEGIDKGVINYLKLFDSKLFPGRFLVPPCPAEVAQRFGFLDNPKTALWVPSTLLNIRVS